MGLRQAHHLVALADGGARHDGADHGTPAAGYAASVTDPLLDHLIATHEGREGVTVALLASGNLFVGQIRTSREFAEDAYAVSTQNVDGITDRVIELGGDEQVTREARDEILAGLDLRDAAGTLGEDEEWLTLTGVVIFIAGESMGGKAPNSIRIRRSEIEAWWMPKAAFWD